MESNAECGMNCSMGVHTNKYASIACMSLYRDKFSEGGCDPKYIPFPPVC